MSQSETPCCPGGRCRPPLPEELTRRKFLHTIAAGTAGLALSRELTNPASAATPLTQPKLPKSWRYPLTRPRVYAGQHLEAVAMPIGGIGTGTVWLDGKGRLSVWQIFNNLTEVRVADSFFALRVKSGNGTALTRVLQTVAEEPLSPMQSLTYEGGYPIARLDFADAALPVNVRLEAFNPMIPTDAANSSIPCAMFRLTAKNTSERAVEVELIAACQNAIGSHAGRGERVCGFGRNRNRVIRAGNFTALAMEKALEPDKLCPVKVRDAANVEVPGPELLWIADLANIEAQPMEALARISDNGGIALVAGVGPEFLSEVVALRAGSALVPAGLTVFEDFEKSTYAGWTVQGEALGKEPAKGTLPGQQPVSGFTGKRLVNTFLQGDKTTGTLTSKPFRIERRYIGFLIGGGKHAETCMNLRMDGKAVRTASGKNREQLEAESWDVAEFKGKEAVIEIVDRHTGGWGHINVDHIVFANTQPDVFLKAQAAVKSAVAAIRMSFAGAEAATMTAGSKVAFTLSAPLALTKPGEAWPVSDYTRLREFRPGENGYRALAATPSGDPLIIEGPLGKGRVIFALAKDLPWSWAAALYEATLGQPLKDGQRIVPAPPAWGSMALAVCNADTPVRDAAAEADKSVRLTESAVATSRWVSRDEITAGLKPLDDSGESVARETFNGALTAPLKLAPGQQQTVTFVLTWHFPNVQRFQHAGNFYTRRWPDALAVARYVAANAEALWQRTRFYHETLYQSNLPPEFLDAMTSQSVIFRGLTCWWSESGYFAGYEGSYGCCPLNCTHVWNYAQTHARLFPEIGRNLRISDLVTYLHDDGETSHRQHSPHKAFMDGHCAVIVAALREHQLSANQEFLKQVWPGLKKATDWIIEKMDADRDGLPAGHQWNTYDTAVSGANTFIGSQYLAALAAAEQLALAMSDAEAASRWRTVREAGMKNQNAKLWNGDYYIQIPETPPARDYNNGCASDQLLGQWWAHQIGLGYLYPQERVRRAMESVMRHNFREKFAGFKQEPRRYIPDDEGGLLICTWPHDDRPKPFMLYSDEVWTGIEYSTAGLMVFEGMIEHARRIVKMARDRYDGRLRDGLNSGPGGNPFNELECGKFYARALSSWSLLIASQGLVLDGPAGVLGFKPRWQPEDHRSFFTAPEGWGLFIQKREKTSQTERIEVRHGRLQLKELVFELPRAAAQVAAVIRIGDRGRAATLKRDAGKPQEARLMLSEPVTIVEGEALDVTLSFQA